MEPPGRPRGPGALRTFLSLAFGFLRVRSLPFEFLLSGKNATGRGRSYTKKGEQSYYQKKSESATDMSWYRRARQELHFLSK